VSAPAIDHASSAAVIKAANVAREKLTARLDADPASPIAEDLRVLIVTADEIAAEHTQLIAANERRTA